MSEETHKKEHDEKHLEKLTIKELREIAADIPHEKAIHEMKKEELIAIAIAIAIPRHLHQRPFDMHNERYRLPV